MGPISTSRARRVSASLLAVLSLGIVGPPTAPSADAAATTPTQPLVDVLESGEQLAPGQSLRAGRFKLVMQNDGNLVEYGDLGVYDLPPRPYWWSGTAGNPGAVLRMQTDGNLVIYSATGRPLWQARTAGHPGARAGLVSNGFFVLYSSPDPGVAPFPGLGVLPIAGFSGEEYDWRLFPGGTMRFPDQLSPSDLASRFQLVMQSDGNLVLQAYIRRCAVPDYCLEVAGYQPYWSSGTHGNPGAFARMQTDGNLVIYTAAGRPLWQSRTAGHPGAHLVLQPDHNVVVRLPWGPALWQSHTAGAEPPKDLLAP